MPVGEKLLTLMKAGLLVRPKNLVAAPIGQIHKLRLGYLNHPRMFVVETGIVFSDYRIVGSNFLQLRARGDAAGNHRIGKYHPPIAAPYARPCEA